MFITVAIDAERQPYNILHYKQEQHNIFYLINMKTAYHMLVVNVQDILELAAIAVV